MSVLRTETGPDGVALVLYDVPGEPVNTLRDGFQGEFEATFGRLAEDSAVKAIVLASAKPDSFVAGADIEMLSRLSSAAEASGARAGGGRAARRAQEGGAEAAEAAADGGAAADRPGGQSGRAEDPLPARAQGAAGEDARALSRPGARPGSDPHRNRERAGRRVPRRGERLWRAGGVGRIAPAGGDLLRHPG